jgi:hypothetical protein
VIDVDYNLTLVTCKVRIFKLEFCWSKHSHYSSLATSFQHCLIKLLSIRRPIMENSKTKMKNISRKERAAKKIFMKMYCRFEINPDEMFLTGCGHEIIEA